MISSYAKLLLVVVLIAHFTITQEAQAGFQNLNQLLDHVENASLEIQKAKANFEITKQRMVLAAQIPNPEVGIGNWNGKAGKQSWKQTDMTITQPIELGGKRGNRMDVADAEIKQAGLELGILVTQLRLKTIFALYRIRQLNEEISFLKEAKETFSHLVRNYKGRPQLSPEQATTLFNFELAEDDYELRIEESIAEYNALDTELKISTGQNILDLSQILPMKTKSWPKFDINYQVDSPMLKVIAAQTKLSEQELKLARSEVWPTVNVGPSFTAQNQFGDKANVLGVVVNLPLPFWNQNDGARAIAAKSIAASQKSYEVEKSISEVRKTNLLKTYQSSTRVLETQADNDQHHKRHAEIESRFLKGMITSPLVIESHRQIYQNQQLYNSRELQTMNVYYQLVLLNGGRVEGIQ
jgi:cobalt-zinc-cadmium efflux system outer membrane protein